MSLETLRGKIDKIDADIIKSIAQRDNVSKKIGQLKTQLNIKVMDKNRENQLMLYHKGICVKYQLSPDLIQRIFKLIITNSKRLQK
jgi:chorismate mutase